MIHLYPHLASTKDYLRLFEASGLPFYIEQTNTTTVVKFKNLPDHLISDTIIPNKDLNFIKNTKAAIEKLTLPASPYTPKTVRYFKFSRQPNGTHYDITELDINRAYWITAHRLGYIDKKRFEDGMQRDKITRLIALGSIASNKTLSEYDPEANQYRFSSAKSNAVTRSYFFHISNEVGQVMTKFITMFPDAVLFFWVDALFIRKEYADMARVYFAEVGYQVKEKVCEKVEISGGYAQNYEVWQGGVKKTFCCVRNTEESKRLEKKKLIDSL